MTQRKRAEAEGRVRKSRSKAIAVSIIVSCLAVFVVAAIISCARIEEADLAEEDDCLFHLDVANPLADEVVVAIDSWSRAARRKRNAVREESDPVLGLFGPSQVEIEEYQAALTVLEFQDYQITHLEYAKAACAFVVSADELQRIYKLASETKEFRVEIRAQCEELLVAFRDASPSDAFDCSPYHD